MEIIKGENLKELYENALKIVEEGVIENIVLNGNFRKEEFESRFLNEYIEDAKLWIQKKVPNELYFNHGKFINKSGDGIDYLIEQLKDKRDSNRACLSLVDMEEIIKNKNDSPLPSFLLLQTSFSTKEENKLLVTVYYRALEVSKFLPLNLAEISLYLKELFKNFPLINNVELNIIAFRAQEIPQFHCLKKVTIDKIDVHEISKAVLLKNYDEIIKWLEEKKESEESIVSLDGLKRLENAFSREIEENNNSDISVALKKAIEKYENIKNTRKSISEHDKIKEESKKAKEQLEGVIKELKKNKH